MKTLNATPAVVSRTEWLEARKAFLAQEKEYSRRGDGLSRLRRELPWVKVEKNYVFDTPQGRKSLGDLFEGRSQLIVYHFMFGPDWKEGCKSCSFLSDHLDAARQHLIHHDVMVAAISRAPLPKLEAFKKRMGWGFQWASSYENDFNRDYHVSFTPEEMAKGAGTYNYTQQRYPSEEAHGISVFAKDSAGEVFHTYSAYARGCDILLGTHNFLDLTPKGRNEENPMDWVRYHDRYED
jgi:predicted dithiol-disulfide oxidoreductase (DUF899 family)